MTIKKRAQRVRCDVRGFLASVAMAGAQMVSELRNRKELNFFLLSSVTLEACLHLVFLRTVPSVSAS